MSIELGHEGLTPEEIEALKIDDGDTGATQGDLEDQTTNGGTNADDEDQNTGADDNGAAAAADDVAAPAAKADGDQPAAAAPEPAAAPSPAQSAPILVAQAPADADAKLADIASKKAEARQKYEDGDFTTDEMLAQLDTLSKQEREIERQIDKATIAAEMEIQRRKNEWDSQCNAFLEAHTEYQGEANRERFEHMNSMLKAIAVMPQNAHLTGPQMLDKAHRLALADRGEAAPAPAPAAAGKPAKQAIPKPALPPSLSGVPAASSNDPGEGKYASLDKLMTTNTAGYEAALAKMSDAERDAYLAA